MYDNGLLFHHVEGMVFESGSYEQERILEKKKGQLRNFINTGDKLYIVAQENGVYKKYEYIGQGKQPVYLHDISAEELRLAESSTGR